MSPCTCDRHSITTPDPPVGRVPWAEAQKHSPRRCLRRRHSSASSLNAIVCAPCSMLCWRCNAHRASLDCCSPPRARFGRLPAAYGSQSARVLSIGTSTGPMSTTPFEVGTMCYPVMPPLRQPRQSICTSRLGSFGNMAEAGLDRQSHVAPRRLGAVGGLHGDCDVVPKRGVDTRMRTSGC